MECIGISYIWTKAWEDNRIDAGKIGRAWAGALGGVILIVAGVANAFPQYSENGDATFCRECHGDFRSSPYLSLSDGVSWGDDLHDIHRNDMLIGDCLTCHGSGPRFPVLLGSSAGGVDLEPISCAGCHGRAEDGTGVGSEGYGAGLRQHHWVAGVTVCGDCHVDADPAEFTPVGEDFVPPYYGDTIHAVPDDPCNPAVDGFPEDYAATTLGLDNDGDDLYDEADTIDCPEPAGSLMLSTGLGFLLLVGRRRTRVHIAEGAEGAGGPAKAPLHLAGQL